MRIMLLTDDRNTEKLYAEAAERERTIRLSIQRKPAGMLEQLFREPFDALLSDDPCVLFPPIRTCRILWPNQIFLLLKRPVAADTEWPESLTFCFREGSEPKEVLLCIKRFPGGYSTPDDPEIVISGFLQKIGVPVSLAGFDYLKESIRLIVSQKHAVDVRSIGDLYGIVAEEMRTSVYAAEHAMRQAIDAAWIRADMNLLERIFGYTICSDRSAPSNAAFLFRAADQIRLIRNQ